ncbi:MAG TPA: methyltransferase [Candidatus Lokiarchaeia archaeon]|nr:methyltransferase [Candidatus Lokiarchaeia archaeon]
MSILWIIRLIFVGMLLSGVISNGIFLKDREKYAKYMENLVFNLIGVIMYNLFAYVAILLPADPNVIPNTFFTSNQFLRTWYVVLGAAAVVIGVAFFIIAVRMRKTVGVQDTGGKLFTSGIYGFCRHPIYVGISLICLALALLFENLDGLLVVPMIFLINLLEGKIEEKYDVGVRFKDEYPNYKLQTRAFGPIWFWIALIIATVLPILIELA